MSRLVVNHGSCTLCGLCESVCPFGGIEQLDECMMMPTDTCRLCGICVKKCPVGALALDSAIKRQFAPDEYRDVLVFAEQHGGIIQDITYELIGKARELANKLGQKATAILVGHGIRQGATELVAHGVNTVYIYDHPALEHFRIEPYTASIVDLVYNIKPNIILMGATSIGRSLAPRVAARLRTGLTADCTSLDVRENGDLVQTRPAFGGNVMARILTPYTRPQMATVRYKVMQRAGRVKEATGRIIPRIMPDEKYRSRIEVLEIIKKPQTESLTEADIIVCGGRGFKKKDDLCLLYELAKTLGGAVAVTRPLIEAGWAPYDRQIGLSGRTVRPKLLLAIGISGTIQFVAGMRSAETIVAINSDKKAPIFDVAHYGLVGDLYEVIPQLLAGLRENKEEAV